MLSPALNTRFTRILTTIYTARGMTSMTTKSKKCHPLQAKGFSSGRLHAFDFRSRRV
ncbi:hypothetical protein CARN8_3830003 [mine drainage metagenome]|uniref:Uncharacterized protein n=1 Tax=mine drainage metagenome TaxID=410659 RepID=A0A3P3ZPC5_9ZZZZ